MALRLTKIEHLEQFLGNKSYSRKWLKNQRNRWIRRFNKLCKPPTKKYKDYEY